jgi:hypothetical protein
VELLALKKSINKNLAMCNKQISLEVGDICKFTPTKTGEIYK